MPPTAVRPTVGTSRKAASAPQPPPPRIPAHASAVLSHATSSSSARAQDAASVASAPAAMPLTARGPVTSVNPAGDPVCGKECCRWGFERIDSLTVPMLDAAIRGVGVACGGKLGAGVGPGVNHMPAPPRRDAGRSRSSRVSLGYPSARSSSTAAAPRRSSPQPPTVVFPTAAAGRPPPPTSSSSMMRPGLYDPSARSDAAYSGGDARGNPPRAGTASAFSSVADPGRWWNI